MDRIFAVGAVVSALQMVVTWRGVCAKWTVVCAEPDVDESVAFIVKTASGRKLPSLAGPIHGIRREEARGGRALGG